MGHTGSRGSSVETINFILTHSDSPPPTELNNYLDGDVLYPTEQIQPRQEVICGHLCLFVSKEMQKGTGLPEIINNVW